MPAAIAYLDEYPWMRCPCGYLLWEVDPGEENTCPGCATTYNFQTVSRRNRYAGKWDVQDGVPTVEGERIYSAVAYEDANRKRCF